MKKKKSLPPEPTRTNTPTIAVEEVKKSARAKKAEPKKTLTIDYPLGGEIIKSGAYTFRLSAVNPERVEVSINGKEWLPCRECVGYWWFDWSGYNSGAHTLVARTPSGKKYVKSKPVQFTVLI